MISVALGSISLQVPKGETVLDVFSRYLSESLPIAALVDGLPVDLSFKLLKDSSLEPILHNTEAALEILRHDTAHCLAQALQDLYPGTILGIGPVIENGFYYDVSSDHQFSSDEFPKIEEKMHEISSKNYDISRIELSPADAIAFFSERGEKYKVELIKKIAQSGETISIYKQGEFYDLCRGPHAQSTAWIKHFKLLKVSSAYWLGNQKNDSLQRIYGTAWCTEAQLESYILLMEEAKKNDHRVLGRDMDLFHFQDEAQGQAFWHPDGYTIYRILESYIRNKLSNHGYSEVKTPLVLSKCLWEKSGHWNKFRENMLLVCGASDEEMALKPMNCPAHIQIFKNSQKSYKDLPMRLAEFGMCHRNEPSGSLHGLMRVRSFVQDDAHIFCTEEQICSETVDFCKLLLEVYKELGFTEIEVRFSDRPEMRIGSDTTWDKAEESLKEAISKAGLPYALNKGEGAFYGPKIEFVLTDALRRKWQCGTLQVDFMLPERLEATYICSDGSKKHPVMLHRAILGTFERFIGILLEHHKGKLPMWLAPVQVCILTITNKASDYAKNLSEMLSEKGIRAKLDDSNQRIDYKIRLHTQKKIPVLWVVGRIEADNKTVSVRMLGSSESRIMENKEALQEVIAQLTSD